MKKLKVLTMSNNHVREWVEFQRLVNNTKIKSKIAQKNIFLKLIFFFRLKSLP